jgi:hypothetical protein
MAETYPVPGQARKPLGAEGRSPNLRNVTFASCHEWIFLSFLKNVGAMD